MNIYSAHTQSIDDIYQSVDTSVHGLTQDEAQARLKVYGANILPSKKPKGVFAIFFNQFKSPLIYILLAAAIMSIVINEWSDAGFIMAVLLINAIIGSIQEHSAQKSATALQQMVATTCRVLRDGETFEINARDLVPGDIILLESGDSVPADIRLTQCHDLIISEAALTGESIPVGKQTKRLSDETIVLAERNNMAFAGTMVDRGRGTGIVIATALDTELGKIASDVISGDEVKAPLMLRMEAFTQRITLIVIIAATIMSVIALLQGMVISDVFLLAVALAVSVIPEGLPVALTVALAIGMHRMAKRNVIVRKLVAVEALGSCTYIATDKTGTLTVNQLTAKYVLVPSGEKWQITGQGTTPEGEIKTESNQLLERICLAASLPNEGFLGKRKDTTGETWIHHGDAVDIAFLVMAHKAGFIQAELLNKYPLVADIPFESERLFSASLNKSGDKTVGYVKGALEQVLPMCNTMALEEIDTQIDSKKIEEQAKSLAENGYRVLALASGNVSLKPDEVFSQEHMTQLTFLGLIGMIDPLREEAADAINRCAHSGISVAMVTGDHPVTARAIANNLELDEKDSEVISGSSLKAASNDEEIDHMVEDHHVFARVEPRQKLDIVQSLQRQGHFVAVSGDGANDAPALRTAQVGVAMGITGTDVARETADLIITDDNFASIVAGIEEGRVAYANVRKVIFLLISTGAAELVLFTLALVTGLPLPLVAVQLLWLNLVTNGIQDVALAFEPAEGDELKQPPRDPQEGIFNRLMIERVITSALVIGIVAFVLFQSLLAQGFNLDEARNLTLLLMVLFENIHVFNSRSETRSVFKHNLLKNKLLLVGTLAAQLIHIGAMYVPWISDVLGIQPVTFGQWSELLFLAFSVLVVMELHKWLRNRLVPQTRLFNN